MSILTYNDFYNNMGLVGQPMMNPVVGATWPVRAWVGMGTRMHGDGLSAGWIAAIPNGPANPNYIALTTTPWENITGWFNTIPAANNTTTNACVTVYDFQTQYFDLTDNTWKFILATSYKYRASIDVNYFFTNTFNGDGAADKLYTGKNNIPAFCPTKLAVSTDRDTPSSDTSKYRLVHNGLIRSGLLDYSKIGAVAVMCKAILSVVPNTGGAFNGNTNIFMQVGADYWPRDGVNGNTGILTGITNIPSVGGSQLRPLFTTEQTFLYVTANINPNMMLETSSGYVQAGNKNYMSDSMFRNHVPQFKTF